MTSTKDTFTAEPCHATMDRGNSSASCVAAGGNMIAQCFDRSNADAEANAKFIAEAFTVAHETGLTPRQLAERCREWKALAVGLGAHLEHLEKHCSVQTGKIGAAHAAEGFELREAGRKLIAMVRAAIAKAEGGAT